MVAPKLKARRASLSPKPPSSSSNYYVLLFVKIVLILLILLWLAPMVESKRRRRNKRRNSRQEMHAQKLDCEKECLKDYLPEEAMNCILHCRSRKCFAEWYGPASDDNTMSDEIDSTGSADRNFDLARSPLEPGEVDLERSNLFDSCHINEIIQAHKKEREDKRQSRT